MADTFDNPDEMLTSNNEVVNESEQSIDCQSTEVSNVVDDQNNNVLIDDDSPTNIDFEGNPIIDSNENNKAQTEESKRDVDIEDIDESDLSFGNSPCPD